MNRTSNASVAWLRLRCLPEVLLLLVLTAIGVIAFDQAIPHPLGTPMEQPLHVANLIPVVLAAAAGAALRPRWDAAYAVAAAGAPTITGRAILVAAMAAVIAATCAGLWAVRAVPWLIALIAAHTAVGCGAAFAAHALAPRISAAPLAAGTVVALLLGLSPWWAATEPILGDAVGIGGSPATPIVEYAIGVLGAVLLIAAGRHRG